MAILSKFDRVRAALAGESLDRVPVALWGHHFRREWSIRDLARDAVEDLRRHDWDFLRFTIRTGAFVEDWGTRYVPAARPDQPPVFAESKVTAAHHLEYLDIPRFNRGAFAEQLQGLRLLRHELRHEAPVIHPIICPLAVLAKLIGDDALILTWLREEPKHVRTGLEVVTETYRLFAVECLEAGANGIFYDTLGFASTDTLSEELYRAFGEPYDRRILGSVGDAFCNVLHLGRSNIHFDSFLDYPVQALAYSSRRPGNPPLDEARERLKDRVALMGGLSRDTLADGTPDQIEREAREAIERTERHHFLLTGEGGLPSHTPAENKAALAALARRL